MERSYGGTYVRSFYCDALMVLALERIPEETKSKVQSRLKHSISGERISGVCGISDCSYWDSVRKTGIVLVSVKPFKGDRLETRPARHGIMYLE